MIQNFSLNIKSIFNNYYSHFSNPLTIDEFNDIETYYLDNLHLSHSHHHNGKSCFSPNLKYISSYSRNYITYKDHTIVEGQCTIPVVYCNNCRHFHAILPSTFIVPYCHYSLSFVLSVLFDKYCSKYTDEFISDKYNISKSTLYRWIKKYKLYLNYYRQLRNKYCMNIFLSLFYCLEDIIHYIFEISGHALFQYDRKLSKPPFSNNSSS